MNDPATYLSEDEITQPRTPAELNSWIREVHDRYASSKEGKEYARMRKGLSKVYFEEVRPLALLAKHLYGESEQVLCQSILGNQNYDAVIENRRSSQSEIIKVEFTVAAEGYEDHLRMKVLAEKGHVSLHGHVKVKGTKHTGHDIQIEGYAIGEDDLTDKAINMLVGALVRKADKHYGQQHWLCVFCDDTTLFRNSDIFEKTRLCVNAVATELNLDFKKMFVLGYSGELLWEIK